MGKVVVSGQIYVPLRSLDEIRRAIEIHVELSRAEEGCLMFDLIESLEEPGRFDLYEEFVDMNAFEQHKLRAETSEWAEVSKEVQRDFEVQQA